MLYWRARFSYENNSDMVQPYCEKYSGTDIEHHYEKTDDAGSKKNWCREECQFKKSIAVAGFAALMLEEADVQKLH